MTINTLTTASYPIQNDKDLWEKRSLLTARANELFLRYEESDCEEERVAIRKEKDELRQKRYELFPLIMASPMHVNDIIMASFARFERHINNGDNHILPPFLCLEEKEFSINKDQNAITVGIGSEVTIGGATFTVGESYLHIHKFENEEEADAFQEKLGLMNAFHKMLRLASFYQINLTNHPETNESILNMLNSMGIDTTQPFTLNNRAFEFVDGVLKSKGYTPLEPPVREDIDLAATQALTKLSQTFVFNPSVDDYTEQADNSRILLDAVDEYKEKVLRGLNALTDADIERKLQEFADAFAPEEPASEQEIAAFAEKFAEFAHMLDMLRTKQGNTEGLLNIGTENSDENSDNFEYMRSQVASNPVLQQKLQSNVSV